ncbi:unnamed protein product [Pylaiella littoralis]
MIKPNSKTALPWVERYRPRTLSELSGNEDVFRALRSYASIESLPHLILYGPPGSGKTSSILAIARQLYGAEVFSSMVLELNASDVRGVDTMRNEIQCFTKCSSVTAGGVAAATKLVILDEADSLTHLAQCALRHLIERSRNAVRFCLCCNYATKISAGIKSRCTTLRFSAMSRLDLKVHLGNVLKQERVDLSARDLDAVLDVCRGDARRAINLLQGLSLGHLEGQEIDVYQWCGVPAPADVQKLFRSLSHDTFAVAFQTLSSLLLEKKLCLARVISALTEEIVVSSEDSGICTDRVRTVVRVFADIERTLLSEGGSDSLCIGATVGAFHVVDDAG